MTKLTKKDILHVAKLSSLKLKEEEIRKFTPQLSKVVEYISELSEVDTIGIEPTSQTTGLSNVFREDNVRSENILNQKNALSGTENTHNGLIKVPAVLSERT